LAEALYSVRAEDALQIDLSHIRGHLPLLAVCYGAMLLFLVSSGFNTREYGRAGDFIKETKFSLKINLNSQVWIDHSDCGNNGVKLKHKRCRKCRL
jgi:GMP synthase (glutamine-hydrolysing)